jgi:uncharacterized protein
VAAGYVWYAQERFLFLRPPSMGPVHAPPGWRLEPVALAMHDGIALGGVLALPPVPRPPLVIYFGGNAQEVATEAPNAEATYGARAVLLLNYRGYGASGGKPGERAMVSDAIETHDWALRRPDLDSKRIAIHGRSLGTGVAVALAAARPVRCVVLTSPYASVREIAGEAFPWLPVSFLLRHPFDSTRRAPLAKMPALVLIGEADDVIAPRHSHRLAAAWGGPVQVESFPGFGHNDVSMNPRYEAAIHAFLDRCL